MHLSTMLPSIVEALHGEAVAIADGMRDLTLRQSLAARGETRALCPNLAATSLVMRIVSVNEALIELRNTLAAGSPATLPEVASRAAESPLDRFPLTGGVASAALRQLAARQEAVERRFDWLCQCLQLSRLPT